MQLNVLLLKVEKLLISITNNIIITLQDNDVKTKFTWDQILFI